MTTIETINSFFNRAAAAWTRGNNSGDSKLMESLNNASDDLRETGSNILKDIFPGIKIDFPGLYPSFEWQGKHFYDVADLFKFKSENN